MPEYLTCIDQDKKKIVSVEFLQAKFICEQMALHILIVSYRDYQEKHYPLKRFDSKIILYCSFTSISVLGKPCKKHESQHFAKFNKTVQILILLASKNVVDI